MKLLIERAKRIARTRIPAVIDGLLAAAENELPADIEATRESDGIALRGRALRMRLIVDARLREFWR